MLFVYLYPLFCIYTDGGKKNYYYFRYYYHQTEYLLNLVPGSGEGNQGIVHSTLLFIFMCASGVKKSIIIIITFISIIMSVYWIQFVGLGKRIHVSFVYLIFKTKEETENDRLNLVPFFFFFSTNSANVKQ